MLTSQSLGIRNARTAESIHEHEGGSRLALLAASVLLAAIVAHEIAAPEGVFLPTLAERHPDWPTTLAVGTLVEQDGCVLLVPSDGSVTDGNLLIWPHEASAERTTTGDLRITVGGTLVGEAGDEVRLGGGGISESQVEELTGESIPGRCRGYGYWLAAPL